MLKTYKNRMLFLVLVFLLFVIAGCSHTATRKGMDGSAAGAQEILEAPKRPGSLPEMPEEKPIVKIISGTKVSGVEEAQRMLSGKKDGFFGMKEMLHTIILKDVPVGTIVGILTEMCGYNVIASNGAAEQKISIYMQDLPLREAIESVCRLNDLWYREDRRVITLMTAEEYANEMVVRRNEKTRAFYMRYTNAEDMAKIIQAVMGAQVELKSISGEKVYGHVEADSSSGGGGSAGEAEPVLTEDEKKKLLALGITEKEGDVVALAEKIGKALPATITVFKRNNCIVARSLDESLLQEMGKIIEALDTPTNQVLLEVKILQINLGDGFESFFQMEYSDPQQAGAGGSFSRGGHALSAMPGIGLASSTLGYVFSNDVINARIEFFASQGRAEILSTPFLMSANNSKVEFFVGEETPLRDDVTTETIYDDEGNIVNTVFEVNIKREELGTDVTISSFINEDSTVTMDVDTEISTANLNMTQITVLNGKTGETTIFPLDGVNKTEIKSMIAAKSGQSVAIGGIIKEQDEFEETKVPFLGDIPVLGFFFKKLIKHKTKTETVIILTPHVITHPALAGKTSGEFLNRRSSHPVIVDEEKNILEYETKD
ncbi:MAG: type II secretion system protein GspD [Proteobacteria bacterium]|nr:type II secretion system protein GspD [Pseudomonadota bacterium]